MKILVVHPSVELYGADKILLHILGFLAEKHNVTLLLPKDGVLVERVRRQVPSVSIRVNAQLPILHSKLTVTDILHLPQQLFRVGKTFSKHSFEMVYCNTLATTLLLYTSWAKKKVIHVHEILGNNLLNLLLSLLVALRTKNVVCVSGHVRNRLHFSRAYNVLYNGIPDEAEDTDKRPGQQKIRFVLPGRIMPGKGQWFLLDTLHCLPESMRDRIEVHLFGSPPPMKQSLMDDLTARIQQLSLTDSVYVHPFCANIQEIYLNADVILVPSIMADPFPTTVLESMMFARPVITTGNGGASEIVKEEFGILINPGDTGAFADAISFFANNETIILDMGKAARKEYEANFTIDIFRGNFHSLLHRVTGAYHG